MSSASVFADDLSTSDKLRVVYSNQFAWTTSGVPLVPVRIAEGKQTVTLSGTGVRLHPDGEGGAEIRGGTRWTVRASGTKPAEIKWHAVVARVPASENDRLQAEMKRWQERGFAPRTFETGSVFAIRGKVLDGRRTLVAIAPESTQAAARKKADEISKKFSLDVSLHSELVDRPHGIVEAIDDRGITVRNEAILWFVASPSGTVEVHDIDKEGGGQELRKYFGSVYVTIDSQGALAVVNAAPEDRLLEGLVPAEMSASSPLEALKAQAVAARNELLAKIGTRHLTDPYRLCSTQHCQVYAGAGKEDPRTTEAVKQTRGELLVTADGGLVDAVYSASCGGHSEDNEAAWGGVPEPELRGHLDIDDKGAAALAQFERIGDAQIAKWVARGMTTDPRPFCARGKGAQSNYRWQKPIDLATVENKLSIGKLRDLTITQRGVSGRALALTATGEHGNKDVRGELEIRRLLGNLKSAAFVFELSRDASGRLQAATASGGGHGHGVGMCQMGAGGMAESGASYKQILLHYYRGARVEKLY